METACTGRRIDFRPKFEKSPFFHILSPLSFLSPLVSSPPRLRDYGSHLFDLSLCTAEGTELDYVS